MIYYIIDTLECHAGFYDDNIHHDVCLPCPIGTYCEFGHGEQSCIECPEGHTTSQEASGSSSECHRGQ